MRKPVYNCYEDTALLSNILLFTNTILLFILDNPSIFLYFIKFFLHSENSLSEVHDLSHRNLNFGKNIATLRIKQKFSQEDLAEKAGISRSMLSKIERDEVSPTIAVANKIARGLNTSVSSLLDDVADERVQVRRLDDRVVQEDPISRIQRELIMYTSDLGLDIQYIISPAGATTGILPAHIPGSEKYVLVEKGVLRVVLAKNSLYELNAGDCLAFIADIEHEFHNIDHDTSSFYVILLEPEAVKAAPKKQTCQPWRLAGVTLLYPFNPELLGSLSQVFSYIC
ncbi:transcriptional regulator [Sporomusaceae bacterium FL31]|nr:transcriptional regulator [Sporomusaceae bacterium FL31]GCE34390.1 transcriptional regulator [Sporomusaceae bacterium]